MYCRTCDRYINGFKARIKHQEEHECLGFTDWFIVIYVGDKIE